MYCASVSASIVSFEMRIASLVASSFASNSLGLFNK